MRQLTSGIVLGTLALLILTMPASAARAWCMRDPVVSLNGHDVGIWVGVPEEYESLVTGPVEVKVYTPVGVTQELIYMDAGFNGFGEDVKFSSTEDLKLSRNGSFDVVIEAWAPIDKDALKAMGVKDKTIPFMVTVITNGTRVTYESGAIEIIDGNVKTVVQSNDKTKIGFTVEPAK